MIRDVKPVGDKLIFASGTELHVVDREPQFFSQRIQSPSNQSAGAKQPSEYRHIEHHILNAHRRDVSCLDVSNGDINIVASGSKDRRLAIWCYEVPIQKLV